MRSFFVFTVLTLAISTVAGCRSQAQDAAVQASYTRSCVKILVEGRAGFPTDFSRKLCKCTLQRILNNQASKLVLVAAVENNRLDVFQSDMDACVERELPAYLQGHPKFFRRLASSKPDSAACVTQRFLARHEDISYGTNSNIMKSWLTVIRQHPEVQRDTYSDLLLAYRSAKTDQKWQTVPSLGQTIPWRGPDFVPAACRE